MNKDDYNIVMKREFKERNKLIEERKEINKVQEQIDQRILRVKIKYLFDNLLLHKIVWHFDYYGHYLTVSNHRRDFASEEVMKEVNSLFDVNFHCSKELESGIKFSFDDGMMSINFDQIDKIAPFVEKYGILVDIKNVEQRVEELDKFSKQNKKNLRSMKWLLKRLKKREENGL